MRTGTVRWTTILPLFLFALICAPTKSHAGLNSWTPLGPPGAAITSIAVSPSDPQTVYVSLSTSGASILVTTNGGATWTRESSHTSFSPRLAVDPLVSTTVYAVASGIAKSVDGGTTWTSTGPLYDVALSFAIDPTTHTTLFAGTSSGVKKSVDGGVTWNAAGNLPSGIVYDIQFSPSSPTTLFASGAGIYRSDDDGASWTDIRGDLSADIQPFAVVVDPSDPQILYAAANDDGIFKTIDGGAHWSGPATGSTGMAISLLRVEPGDPSHLYAGTTESGLLQSSDSGDSWQPDPNVCSSTIGSITIDPADSTHVTLGGTGGYFESIDSGDSWNRRTSGLPDSDAVAVVVDAADSTHLIAATYGGFLWESTNSGTSWSSLCDPGTNTNLLSLAVATTDPSTIYLGTEDGVYRSTDGGADWTFAGLGGYQIGSIAVDSADPLRVYAGDYTGARNGELFYSTDGGDVWSVPAATLPAFNAVTGFAVDPSTPGTAYVTWRELYGSPGDVWKTIDGGNHWSSTHLPGSPPANSVAIAPSDPSILYVSSDYGVYKSTDAGGSWVTLPSTIRGFGPTAVDPGNPDVVYVNYALSKSTDGGSTWSQVQIPHSLYALAVDPAAPSRLYGAFLQGGIEALDQTNAEVDSLLPTSGPTTGGTLATISGNLFIPSVVVTVGGIPATVVSTTTTSVTIEMPPHALGPVDVTVANPIGSPTTLARAFTYTCGNPTFTALVSGGGSYCANNPYGQAGISASLSGVPPWTITWSDGFVQESDYASAFRSVSPSTSTIYTITDVIDASGCGPGAATGSATVTVEAPPAPPIVTAPLFVAPYSPTDFTASVPAVDGLSYGWWSDSGSITDGWNTGQVTFQAYWPGSVADLEVVGSDSSCTSDPAVFRVPVDFLDVPPSHPFHDYVDAISAHAVTHGCNDAGYFCPDGLLDREHMAAFLARAHDGGDNLVPNSGTINGTPYDCNWGSSYFTDVPVSDMFCRYVNRIAALGITIGCAPQKFCPHLLVTREQMALFIGRAIAPGATPPSAYSDGTTGRSYDCSAASPFPDVAANTESCNAIGYIWAKGIVDGFGDGTFRPNDDLTRAPAAKFIANAFGLKLGS